MSRYGGYDGPPPERWDAERFQRERERIERPRTTVVERDRFEERDRYESRLSPPNSARRRESSVDEVYISKERERKPSGRFEERDRIVFEERNATPSRRPRAPPARYWEEDLESEGAGGGEVIPFERRRPSVAAERNYGPPARRPDGRPQFIRRQSSLDTFDRKPLPRYGDRLREPPEVIPVPIPPRRRSPPRFVERDYEEIRIAEPDHYGDEDYRAYREREVETVRRRRAASEVREREEIIDEYDAPEAPAPPGPKRGKTKIPMRLINKRAIIELGYPFEEEGETLIILKALPKELIDEVIAVSKEMNEKGESRTTYLIEAPAPPQEQVIERRTEVIINPPVEIPRSVREWDVMSLKTEKPRDPSPSAKSHKSHKTTKSHKSHRASRSRHRSASTARRSPSSSSSSSSSERATTTLIVPQRRKSKNEAAIQAEIRALEAEQRALKYERQMEKEVRQAQRYREVGRDGEVIIERERPEKDIFVEVKKDKKEPNPRLIKAMLATLT